MRRELLEELGIEVAVGALVEAVTHAYEDRTVHLRFYRCQWLQCEPRALGCQDFAWIMRSSLADYTFPAADRRLLETLQSRDELWG